MVFNEITGTIKSDSGTTEFGISKKYGGWQTGTDDECLLYEHQLMIENLTDVFNEINAFMAEPDGTPIPIKPMTENFSLFSYWLCPACGTYLIPNAIERKGNIMFCPECEYQGAFAIPEEVLI